MENIPNISEHILHPLTIPVTESLLDHRFQGQPVLPAVIAMEHLARAVRHHYPDRDISIIENARFNRFLKFDAGMSSIPAIADISVDQDENIHCSLVTSSRAKSGAITRRLIHAELIFPKSSPDGIIPPMDLLVSLEGKCFTVPDDRVYSELVPFGPAFNNIRGDLCLTRDGAIGLVHGGCDGSPMLLGSPYPADASFHCACVWGQRYLGVVGFPVAFSRRVVCQPARFGEDYHARIVPAVTDVAAVYNAFILDAAGNVCEAFFGLAMRDVSSGSLAPPRWLVQTDPGMDEVPVMNGLPYSLIELNAVLPCCEKVFTAEESARYPSMHVKRKRSYAAARIALKRLSRKRTGDRISPADTISTAGENAIPVCPGIPSEGQLFCSVSHDSRFSIAIIDTSPIGIDVEERTERLLKGHSLFMNEDERSIVLEYSEGPLDASLRVWTTKEAIAKAFGLTLVDAWQKASMITIGTAESSFSIDDKMYYASHEIIDNHLFTLVRTADASR